MSNTNECPFCGGTPIRRNPLGERIKGVHVGVSAAVVSASAQVKVKPNPTPEEYYQCNGCKQRYVLADINISLILEHLRGDKYIIECIKFYYPDGVTLTDLLEKYRTGIVRRHSSKPSWLPDKIIKEHLYVCFNYNGKRTFATFLRKGKKGKYYYVVKDVGVPNI